ncbi:hypothetical protein FA13DRAFT_1592778, partial [Coprinellus micaceus]
IVAPTGWPDVTVGLRFFSRALEQNNFLNKAAVASAKVLQVVAAHQPDLWYTSNAA